MNFYWDISGCLTIYTLKMKTLTFLFFGLLLCPMTLLAQSADVLLQKVADALSAGKDDYAVSLFRQAADADAGQTEMFYWTSVGKPLRQLRGLRAGTGRLLQRQTELRQGIPFL